MAACSVSRILKSEDCISVIGQGAPKPRPYEQREGGDIAFDDFPCPSFILGCYKRRTGGV